MTGEMIAIIGVGIALAAFNWRVMVRLETRLDARMDRLEARIDRLEGRLDGLQKKLHDLAREFYELRGEIRASRA